MPKISFFEKLTNTKPNGKTEFSEVMKAIKSGAWRHQVEQVRAANTDAERKARKEALPGFTGSGVFSSRSLKGLKSHSGRIIIDIDKLDDVEHVKEQICADTYVEYAFTSCSGNGLALVLKINPEEHNEVFPLIKEHFEKNYGIEVDKGVRDVSRIRFVSYDPDIWHNPKAKTFATSGDDSEKILRIAERFILNATEGHVHDAVIKASRLVGGYIAGMVVNDETEAEERLLAAVMSKPNSRERGYELKNITDGIENGKKSPLYLDEARIAIKDDERTREAFASIYKAASEINRAGREFTDLDIKFNAEQYLINKDRVKAIFEKVFTENKEEHGLDDKPTIYKIEVFLRSKYDFRKNEINNAVECKPKNGSTWHDVNPDQLHRVILHVGYKFDLAGLKSLLRSDFVPTYNPFAEYFAALPEWDGEDHAAKLAKYISTDDDEFFASMLKKHLIRSVGCGLHGIENRFVFTLVGEKQNAGKSTFVRFISPFGMKYFTEAPISNDKDSEISFAENFIYNLEELDSLNKHDMNRLKSVISKRSVNVRRPYSAQFEQLARRCNFFASTNLTDFLVDTENTRFLCFSVNAIDWGYSSKVNIRDVWAQAFALYVKDPKAGDLTAEEAQKQAGTNHSFEFQDIERDMVQLYFEPCEASDPEAEDLTNFQILTELNELSDNKIKPNSRVLGRIFAQLGYHRWRRKKSGNTLRGWTIKRTPEHKDRDKVNTVPKVEAPKEEEDPF